MCPSPILKNFQTAAPADVRHFHRVISQAADVQTHFDLLIWLQGEMQYYLPHDIMIAAWGNFLSGNIQLDVISPMAGVRTHNTSSDAMKPLLKQLYRHWTEGDRSPCATNISAISLILDDKGLQDLLGQAHGSMRSMLIHGLGDERNGIECLYVTFSTKPDYGQLDLATISVILPHIDVALCQLSPLPEPAQTSAPVSYSQLESSLKPGHNMSTREVEIMFWVALGKTNSDIGRILNLSEFTVKNHMQRVFKKLNVINRAQAVSAFKELCT